MSIVLHLKYLCKFFHITFQTSSSPIRRKFRFSVFSHLLFGQTKHQVFFIFKIFFYFCSHKKKFQKDKKNNNLFSVNKMKMRAEITDELNALKKKKKSKFKHQLNHKQKNVLISCWNTNRFGKF